MLHLINLVKLARNDDSGATAIEYGLIAGLVAVVLIAGMAAFTPQLEALFTAIGTQLGTATP